MTESDVPRAVQSYLEEHLLAWHGVTRSKTFGHVSYHIEGRMFAFIGDTGIVLKPPTDERAPVRALDGAFGWSPEPGADTRNAAWIEVPCANPEAIDGLLPYLSHAMAFVHTTPQTGWRAERRRKGSRQTADGSR